MKNKKIFAWICIIALIGLAEAQSYVVVSGSSLPTNTQSNLVIDYDLSKYDQNLEPGDIGTLTLVIKNTGTQDATDVLLNIPSTPKIRIDKRFFIGSVKYGAPATVSLTYQIAKDAEVGQHSIPIRLTYDGKDSDGNAISNIQTNYDYPLKVYGNPKLSIKYLQADDAKIGGDVTLKVTIMNMKTNAFNTVATLSPQTQLVTVLGSNKQYIGEIDSAGTIELTYIVHISDTLESGAYTIPLKLEYENKGHIQHTETFDIGVYVSGKPDIGITEVTTDPQEANPGDEDVEVKVKVENIGTQEVKSLKVSLKTSDPFMESKSYLQTKDLGTVKAGHSSTVSFYVDISDTAKEGIYDLDFQMDYLVGTEKTQKTETVRIVIKEKPDFKVEAQETASYPGSMSKMDVKVTNTGKDCESVTVWVLKKTDHPFDFDDKSQLIGDLDSGETGEALLEYSVKENAQAKEYLLPLEIRCSKDNKVYITTDKAKITVDGRKPDGESNMFLPALVVLVAALLTAAWIVKKSLGKKPQNGRKK
ncbi:MAG: COG1361 S-layer family protein [Candidatus Altiarchaeota archaeon]|nr:COG1361 S-layer family protein [Candidatus Altiarchaeota archaeon]